MIGIHKDVGYGFSDRCQKSLYTEEPGERESPPIHLEPLSFRHSNVLGDSSQNKVRHMGCFRTFDQMSWKLPNKRLRRRGPGRKQREEFNSVYKNFVNRRV